MNSRKLNVGIFSREYKDNYSWLMDCLLTMSVVANCHPVQISNNFLKFLEELSRCDFAILYHSKNRGRVNITDVTDSLYDKELKDLNQHYGRERVLVVIDDLDESDDERKAFILNTQPTIQAMAQDLFLFSVSEKAFLDSGNSHLGDRYQSQTDLLRKLDHMQKIIEDSNKPLWNFGNGDDNINQDIPRQSQRCDERIFRKWLFILAGVSVVVFIIIILAVTLSPK